MDRHIKLTVGLYVRSDPIRP